MTQDKTWGELTDSEKIGTLTEKLSKAADKIEKNTKSDLIKDFGARVGLSVDELMARSIDPVMRSA